jgi:hypothetical protein
MWMELLMLNLGIESCVRLVFGTRRVAVTSLPERPCYVACPWHCICGRGYNAFVCRSCSEVGLGRVMFPKILFLICVVTFSPILPVCVCIQFPAPPSRLPAVRKHHIYPDNFCNRRYDITYVVWQNLFLPFQAGEGTRNFEVNSLPCPPRKLHKWCGETGPFIGRKQMHISLETVLGYLDTCGGRRRRVLQMFWFRRTP